MPSICKNDTTEEMEILLEQYYLLSAHLCGSTSTAIAITTVITL